MKLIPVNCKFFCGQKEKLRKVFPAILPPAVTPIVKACFVFTLSLQDQDDVRQNGNPCVR